ncbi:hypothetical protein [Microbacterium sp. LWH12-1.2]|uniref:hypothetical protein n=1 Tax=Microbacterium sp. LWH12-1.2 TaxID=3135259 RepID=UPI003417CE4D
MTDTLNAVDQAIQRHIGEIGQGAIAESWIIIVHSQTIEADGVSGYRILTSDTQPHHVDRGLLDVGQAIVAASWDDNLYESDDDE